MCEVGELGEIAEAKRQAEAKEFVQCVVGAWMIGLVMGAGVFWMAQHIVLGWR